MSTPVKYLKDESNNTFSPAVSVDSIFTKGGGKLVDYIYPIGSIYMSVNSTNPSQLFGGTWTQLKDRFLLGVGDTYKTVSSTGGVTTHQHTFGIRSTSSKNLTAGNSVGATLNGGNSATTDNTKIASGQSINVNSVLGSGSAWDYMDGDVWVSKGTTTNVNNLPPYLTVYMWKRTK